jgi:15-cis-phytoene desaturase
MANSSGTVVVIGAGLAGMTAAVYLSEAGYSVQVLEANPFLGGRTSSWTENRMEIESGLHRFLGFYTALPDVLRKVGVDLDTIVHWEDEIEVRMPDGVAAVIGLAPLHKPLKTFEAVFGNNDFLPPADKLAIGKMFAAGTKDYVSQPEELDQISVLAYARRHHVSKTAVQRLLVPLTEGIFFLPVAKYSMYNLMGLFMPYLKSLPKLRVGAFTGGMSEVMMVPLANFVRKHGGKICARAPVSKLLVEGDIVVGVKARGQEYRSDFVVLATSLYPAQQLIKKAFGGHAAFRDLLRLPNMPAVTFQLELKRPSMKIDRTTFGPGTALASFAEQSRTTFSGSPGRLSVILSPPKKFLNMPPEDILKIVLEDAERLGLHIADDVVAYRKVRLPNDFYSLATGSEALRPPQKTPIPGLVLAGDYTKQPYLATMEGAVVSGKLAAEAIFAQAK